MTLHRHRLRSVPLALNAERFMTNLRELTAAAAEAYAVPGATTEPSCEDNP